MVSNFKSGWSVNCLILSEALNEETNVNVPLNANYSRPIYFAHLFAVVIAMGNFTLEFTLAYTGKVYTFPLIGCWSIYVVREFCCI